MADGNEMYDTIMRELNNLVFSDTDETKDDKQHESFSFQEEDIDDVPPSLLSYFETSKSRAAVCEKLILEEPEDFTAHLTEDMMSLPIEPDKDLIKLNEQVIRDTENEDNTSTDTRLLPTPSETEALFTHNVSVCPNNEGEAETGVYMESEKHSPFDVRTTEISLNEEERKKRAEREKRHCEEIKHEEQKRQIERDFQKELKNIMEAEKLHQKELELMEKRAQDKLEQELLLQQELIRNLQRRVEEERRRMEEEQKRMKDEEDKKKKEEETIKMEAERKRMKEETRRKKEEEIKIEEIKLKEENRRMKTEEKRKREEEKNKTDLEKKKIEDDKRMMKEEEEGKRKEGEEKGKGKDERKQIEEVNKKRKMEQEINLKEEERKGREDVNMRTEEEGRKKMEEKKEVKEVVRNGEGENRKKEEQQQLEPIKEDEKRKKEDERKTKEEKQRRRQEEEIRRHRDEEDYRKSEEEIQDKQEYKGCDVDNREMEHESKTKDEEKKQQEERKDVHVEKEPDEEEVGEKEDNKTEEEIRLHEKEESKERVMQDTEREVKVVRAHELQEKREKAENNSIIGEKEKNYVVKSEDSQASSPGSSHRESPVSPTSTETIPHQDRGKNISQASIDKTMDCENQAERPFTASVFLPVCLPEHTEQKRLCWMKDCIPWSKLSLLNRRKQKGPARSRRGPRRAAEASSLPPLCPDSLLQSTGWKSLQEVTTVALEDLPGCSLSTLAQCTQLQALTLRRCALKSLEGINQLQQLCYIDVQENDISFVDCEYMTSLRVLHLGHNKLTSIHGLTGAENLDVLNLSHNCITRIAGLESMRRLQRLSVDHNQLISTRGLRDVYTLLHLNCSHNHLASVEGLENSALLNTLDLRANSLTEPPSLNSQVLLRELHLDDNSISSLQSLTACWLPLMQHLSVAQNRITQLPFMSDSVSLAKLDLRFNCLSELQNLCESLEGCQFLREVHLTGNPLQQENGWRSTLQKAVPGLRAIDVPETDSFLSPPAVQRVSLALGSFLTLCQAQLQQTHALQQRHGGELSNASSALDAVKTSCRHFTEALQLAKDQRFAHEYGATTVADKHSPAGRTTPEETCNVDSTDAEKCPEISARRDTHNTATKMGPQTRPTAGRANSNSVHFLTTKGKTTSSLPASNHQDLDLQSAAAVVIQQLWRKYRQKCRNISSTATVEKGGGGGRPESGPSYMDRSVVGRDYAATVIQAFWRGFTLRRRLASALAAVTSPDTGEDDIFEEVDVDEFVFDEAALEKHWTLPLSEDSPPRRYPVSEQPLSLKPPQPLPEPSQYILPPPLVWRSKQAWVAGEQVDSAGQAVSSNSSSSPASTSVLSGLSEKSEKILEEWGFTHSHTALLMLKRAQNMTSKKKQHKKRRDPSVRLTLFRNCSYQLAPVEARNRRAQRNRNDIKAREAEQGLQQAERTERVKQEPAQQRLHTQAARSDRDSQSLRFLPEISSDILNGGRVQLVADPGYTERLHRASGLWSSSSLAVQPSRENNYLRRNSLGHERKEVPSPQRVTSAPSQKERISFRDNPVQLSLGWGGGKKRDKVYK